MQRHPIDEKSIDLKTLKNTVHLYFSKASSMIQVTSIEHFSVKATRWIGSVESLIVHTCLFASAFWFLLFDVSIDQILLVLTTILSFEAIYLSIFIQMSVNRHENALKVVGDDVAEIQEDITGIEADIEEIQEDVWDISEDIEEITENIEEIREEDPGETVQRESSESSRKNIEKYDSEVGW